MIPWGQNWEPLLEMKTKLKGNTGARGGACWTPPHVHNPLIQTSENYARQIMQGHQQIHGSGKTKGEPFRVKETKDSSTKDFPGGPVATRCQRRGPRFHPWSGNWILYSATKTRHSQVINKYKWRHIYMDLFAKSSVSPLELDLDKL